MGTSCASAGSFHEWYSMIGSRDKYRKVYFIAALLVLMGIAACWVGSSYWPACAAAKLELPKSNPAPAQTHTKSESRPPSAAQISSGASQQQVASFYAEAERLIGAGRLPEALASYEKAISLAPNLGETYLRLGLLYFKLKLPAKSEEYYLKAVERGVDSAEVYFQLGYIEETRGMRERALEYYLKAESKGLRNPELFYNIGNMYAQLGRNTDAIRYYKKVVIINPEHMDAFVNLSVVSYHMQEYADAGFYLDKAVKAGYKAPPEYVKVLEEKTKK